MIVGHPVAGRVLILDDVISAGTSVQESVKIIREAGATPAAVAIALDRQERGSGKLSAVQEIEREFQIKVVSIANLDALLGYLRIKGDNARVHFDAINTYRQQYGV